jgi:hypothetical protein
MKIRDNDELIYKGIVGRMQLAVGRSVFVVARFENGTLSEVVPRLPTDKLPTP